MVVPHDAPGELETLVWRGWCADPANAARLSCIQAFEGCMQAAGVAAQSPDKARLQALLSLLNDDDPRLGPGARARKLDLGSPALLPPVTFLRGVASP
ncbi:MAG: hypothetical protein HY904_23155 [Deltaproteobacteria bacterium]|nr:hypothetical protein [Deltaproteobacteria bacterium]